MNSSKDCRISGSQALASDESLRCELLVDSLYDAWSSAMLFCLVKKEERTLTSSAFSNLPDSTLLKHSLACVRCSSDEPNPSFVFPAASKRAAVISGRVESSEDEVLRESCQNDEGASQLA